MRSKPSPTLLFISTYLPTSLSISLYAFLCTSLTGCYTQLLTRGYGEQTRNSETQYAKQPQTSGDTLAPSENSPLAVDESESESDSTATPSVIVNNYYERDATYRGYSNFDWDYPLLSFSFYSSRYRSYSDPYWWHSSGSYRDRYYRYYDQPRYGHHHHGSNYYNKGNTNPGNSKYQSEQRIFTPPPHYPQVQKGRRSRAPDPVTTSPPPSTSTPAPKSTPAPSPAPSAAPAPPSAPSQISAPAYSEPAPSSTPPRPISHPKLEKGKRR